MMIDRLKEGLLQGSNARSSDLFKAFMQSRIRQALWELMQEEVDGLCGPLHGQDRQKGCGRAGSEAGVFYLNGHREPIKRPRVRAGGQEVGLNSYRAARDMGNIQEEVYRLMASGVSTRAYRKIVDDGPAPSTVSRLWAQKSAQKLLAFRKRDLSGYEFFGLTLDGVHLGAEAHLVVACGLTAQGEKLILDFARGSSESYEVARDLLTRIQMRGFKLKHRPYSVIDGSEALAKAVLEFWPEAVIQYCLVHLERTLHRYLRRRDHGECNRLLKNLRLAQGAQAGREALQTLRTFLQKRNLAALEALERWGDSIIALHLLEVPATLNVSLLSTNLIENAIRNYRQQTRRVKRWHLAGNQIERWSAVAFCWIEQGFRKIKGHQDLPLLIQALQTRQTNGEVARTSLESAPLRPSGSAPPTPPQNPTQELDQITRNS